MNKNRRKFFLQMGVAGITAATTPSAIAKPEEKTSVLKVARWKEEELIPVLDRIGIDLALSSIKRAWDKFYGRHGVTPDGVFVGPAGSPSIATAIAHKMTAIGMPMAAGVDSRLGSNMDVWYVSSLKHPNLRPVGSVGA